ncbi:Tetracycline resistance protein from transposon Tn4351/Tn4400 [Bacteroides fragilis] [Rhizoctonia solani]|uniref:Tetracycline resistance protein from transposon Tn4351/Tn4400 [Bacteroides fragilis] n=1 Tax=Rhizoctonia solani TaxID=456999 RepID=A0A0K6FXD8_9AGAM|nr:Tetracycline resistance protein from transposon Tn4351/Tn4400 [Bacteroides fragilis] [Rhizoctonia solani]
MSAPRIAIIGAGPGGLTLACILLRHSIVPIVYERDPSPDFRPQGGTLDLHVHSGQQALHEAGLFDEFLKHARYDGQATRFLTKTGELVHEPRHGDSAETARPEIDRTDLRNILLRAFGVDKVHWGHAVASVEPASENKYDLHFKDGKVESGFDLVVGADGAWSRVRPLLTTATPGDRYDTVNALVRRGSAFGFGDQKAIIGQRLGTNAIRIYAGFATDGLQADWLETQFDEKDPRASKEKALTFFESWSPDLLDLVRLADDSVLFRPLYMLPTDLTWEPRPGLTLLGDAAHLMTPFAGEGVNITMWDSLEVGKKVIEGIQTGDINQAIRDYEAGLFERGGKSMKKTDQQRQAFFAKNYPESVKEIIERMRAGRGARN